MAEYNFDELGRFQMDENDANKYVVFACAKNEEGYIREWVEYYLSIGFDKVFIADNNEEGNDLQYQAVKDYVDSGIVQMFDVRGHESVQVLMYSRFCECGNYKWCGYFDCDEFFEMGVYNNVKDFLPTLEEYDCISFNWVLFGPNGNVFKKEGSIRERFPNPLGPILYMKENVFIKSIVKGGEGRFKHCWFNGSHIPACENPDIKYSIGGYNEPYASKTIHAHFPPSYKLAYIRHYYTKSYEEWKVKAGRGWPDETKTLDISRYYLFNESYAVPVDNFLNGLFIDGYKIGREWEDRINEYSVIKLNNEGDFVYPFIVSVISLMSFTTGHTFVFQDAHIDDTMYAIFLEYAMRTGNKICYVRDDDEMWKAFINNRKFGEPTYYIIGYS